jgi:hypothetical protein
LVDVDDVRNPPARLVGAPFVEVDVASHDLVTGVEKGRNHHGPDIAKMPCDQNFNGNLLFHLCFQTLRL